MNEETRPPAVLLADIQLSENTQTNLPTMPYIYIVPISTPAAHWLGPLEKTVAQCFGQPVKRMHCDIDLEKAYDFNRRQYNSSQILLQLINSAPDDALKILGVVAVDLYIPILTYVFGEAQLGGTGALVSMHRLNNRLYGLPDNDQLLCERLNKEAIHELGHTFGLLHCSIPGCVLSPSTYVEDIDQKNDQVCQECRKHLADHVSV